MTTKKPEKAMIPWDEEMAKDAKAQTPAPATGGGDRPLFSFQGGIMMFGDLRVKENKTDVLILDYAYANQYYDKPYNPNVLTSPVCYALGRDKTTLAPHPDAEDPQGGKSGGCADCPMNEWGSRGNGGQGKACKNSLRLTVMSAGDLDGDISKAAIAYMNIPPTSVKRFGAYIKSEFYNEAGDQKCPTWAYGTTVEVQPDAKTQFNVLFERAGGIDLTKKTEQYLAVREKVKKLADDVLFAFPRNEDRQQGKGKPSAPAKKAKHRA